MPFEQEIAQQAATAGLGSIMGMMMGGWNDERQLKQQRELQNMQEAGNKRMLDYSMMKQLEMWQKTGPGAYKELLEQAGLNSALMYGMSGGGGQTTGGGSNGVSAGNAPSGGGEIGMGIQQAMQLQLLKAQKENIEADTDNKKAGAKNLTASAEGQGLENALTAWLQGTTPEGQDAGTLDKSVRGQAEIRELDKTKADTRFKLDENERQALMNSKVMQEIGAKISLMKAQGQTQEQIYKNLVKEGAILDAEIEWNALDISEMSVGKFLMNIIKMLFRPR